MSNKTNGEILVLLRLITSPLSLLGSCAIVYLILSRKGKRGTYHRFMMGISLTDIGFTTAFLFGISPLPRGVVEGARGTVGTCEARAFFVQWFGTLGPFYNVCLELYYVCLIRYGVKEIDFARKYEVWYHAVINIIALGLAVAGLVADVYNPSLGQITGCYINSFPPGCSSDPDVECERGENAIDYFFALGLAPYYAVLFLLYGCLAMILWTVIRKDCETKRFQQRNEPSTHGNHAKRNLKPVLAITRTVTIQSILYGVFFTLTYLAFTIFRSFIYFDDLSRSGLNLFPLSVINSIFLPLQGLFNFFVFVRPKFAKLRQNHPERSLCWVIWHTLSRKTSAELLAQERALTARSNYNTVSNISQFSEGHNGKFFRREERDVEKESRTKSSDGWESDEEHHH